MQQVAAALAPLHGPIGRPSIDPELMIGMLIVGEAVALRDELRWFAESSDWKPVPGRCRPETAKSRR